MESLKLFAYHVEFRLDQMNDDDKFIYDIACGSGSAEVKGLTVDVYLCGVYRYQGTVVLHFIVFETPSKNLDRID